MHIFLLYKKLLMSTICVIRKGTYTLTSSLEVIAI